MSEGRKQVPVLLDGLRRLEYRGYELPPAWRLLNGKPCSDAQVAGRIANSIEVDDGKAAIRNVWHRSHAMGHPWQGHGPERASPFQTPATSSAPCTMA